MRFDNSGPHVSSRYRGRRWPGPVDDQPVFYICRQGDLRIECIRSTDMLLQTGGLRKFRSLTRSTFDSSMRRRHEACHIWEPGKNMPARRVTARCELVSRLQAFLSHSLVLWFQTVPCLCIWLCAQEEVQDSETPPFPSC